jgi:hypothetical protein
LRHLRVRKLKRRMRRRMAFEHGQDKVNIFRMERISIWRLTG